MAVFADLPADFYIHVSVQPLEGDRVLHINHSLAARLGFSSEESSQQLHRLLTGRESLPGQPAYSSVYSGHQFGTWAGQLGDGRAHTLGTLLTDEGPCELQLKGSGKTPYSRMGDGRAVLRSSIREYLASYAMKGLGIPTTEALGLVSSQEQVQRESWEPAAMVLRTAPSFVRYGHFQHWFAAGRADCLQVLLDFVGNHVLEAALPDFSHLNYADKSLRLLELVIDRTAELIASWQLCGFVHGVMNTDNMSILGLTLDYGPYGFMDDCILDWVCNHTDYLGCYAYHKQPQVALWNLYQLASSFTLLEVSKKALQEKLDAFSERFMHYYHQGTAAKLGLTTSEQGDSRLFQDLWSLMHRQRADFTQSFRRLSQIDDQPAPWLALYTDQTEAQAWLDDYRRRLKRERRNARERQLSMDQINPKYVLRNHIAQKVIEETSAGRTALLEQAVSVFSSPYTDHKEAEFFERLPEPAEKNIELSCSS